MTRCDEGPVCDGIAAFSLTAFTGGSCFCRHAVDRKMPGRIRGCRSVAAGSGRSALAISELSLFNRILKKRWLIPGDESLYRMLIRVSENRMQGR